MKLTDSGLRLIDPPEETPTGARAELDKSEFFEALKLRSLDSLKVLHLILSSGGIKSVDLGIERSNLITLLKDSSSLILALNELPPVNYADWNEFWKLPLIARGTMSFKSKNRGFVTLIVKGDPTLAQGL